MSEDFLKDLYEMRQNVECCPGNTYLGCKDDHARVARCVPVYYKYVDEVIQIAHELKCTSAEAWAYWDIKRRNVPTGDAGSPILDDSKRDSTRSSVRREPSVEKTIKYHAPTCLPLPSSTMPKHPLTSDETVIERLQDTHTFTKEQATEKLAFIRDWLDKASKALVNLPRVQARSRSPRSRSPPSRAAFLEAGSDYASST